MPDKKPKADKAKVKKPVAQKQRPAVQIVIGASGKIVAPSGVQVWALKGSEVTKDGDRRAIASLTSAELHQLGWVRRKY